MENILARIKGIIFYCFYDKNRNQEGAFFNFYFFYDTI